MSTVTVRPATASDLPALARLSGGLFATDAGRFDPWTDQDWPAIHPFFREVVDGFGPEPPRGRIRQDGVVARRTLDDLDVLELAQNRQIEGAGADLFEVAGPSDRARQRDAV